MNIKPSELGTRFLENYELGEYIDKGGNGSIYKVTRNHDGSIFALKCLLGS